MTQDLDQDWPFLLRLMELPLDALEKGELPVRERDHELNLTEICVQGHETMIKDYDTHGAGPIVPEDFRTRVEAARERIDKLREATGTKSYFSK